MAGYCKKEDGQSKVKFTYKMHEVVANFMCKLLEATAFCHLQVKLESEQELAATDGWKVGDKATKKLVDWCQDQWRRKEPDLPEESVYGSSVSSSVPLFAKMPVCHQCGVPCPDCREELQQDVPEEMSTIRAYMYYNQIHESSDVDEDLEDAEGASTNRETTPWNTRRLRKRRKEN